MRPDYCPVGNEPCQSMCDKPCATKHSALDHLCDLLAILHGDGGHYLDAHGMDKAVADAKERYYAKLTEADAHAAAVSAERDARIKELEDALRAICSEQDARQGYASVETYDAARAALGDAK